MKPAFRIAFTTLLAMAATPALALQLGQIQVKSALNQPLVAAIPLHPKNLTELDGLTAGLAPASDFARAGLQLTPTDQTLRFHVTTDNNGQKLILVTSSQPVTDPYLDFLVQVNTRQGKQVREFVVLLNPVIAAPAPAVKAAPTPAAPAGHAQPAQLPAPSQFPQPRAQPATATPAQQSGAAPQPQPTALPPQASQPSQPAQPTAPAASITVHHGDTLYGIASNAARGPDTTINQLMLALKAANPDAFFKNNINNLKAGAILRIPTRNEVDRISVARANAEVHRQYEAWRATRPHPATVLAGAAERAAANAAPKPGNTAPASDHLSLAPPAGQGGGANNRAGVAGGTGSETVAGLRQRLQDDRDALVSLHQSNSDLASRAQNLKDIAGKTDKLLSLKDATVAELQHKLAQMHSGTAAGVVASAASKTPADFRVAPATTGSGATTAVTSNVAAKPATSAVAAHPPVARHAKGLPKPGAPAWYQRPVTWIVAGLIVLALILIGLFSRKRRVETPVRGPLPDPEDMSALAAGAASPDAADTLQAWLVEHPHDLEAHLELCRWYYTQDDTQSFAAAARAMREDVADPGCVEWREVEVMGAELAPQHPLFAQAHGAVDDPYGLAALHVPVEPDASAQDDVAETGPMPAPAGAAWGMRFDAAAPDEARYAPNREAGPEESPAASANATATPPVSNDDPVDTKLDLARAYLDMGDPTGARSMLEEVLAEGSQMQQDEANRLLAEAGVTD